MINYKRLAAILIAAIVFTLAGIPTQIQNTAKASTTTTPGTCDWTGTWDTNWGKMELVQTGSIRSGADITGTASRTPTVGYSKIVAVALGGMLAGTWSKPPSYGPPADAGDIELTISRDCNSFTGKWRYGYGTGKWDGDWTGRRTGSGSSSPPTEQPSKEIVCASAKPRIADGSQFKRAWFTIGGTMPQKVSITQSAENFAIKKEYGKVVFHMTRGKSWGSLTLEPGTYILSCNGGGVMGLMSASVCVEFPSSNEIPSLPSSGGQTVQPDPKDKKKPSTGNGKPFLPPGPIERIIIRPVGDSSIRTNRLHMKTGDIKHFEAWGMDAAHPNDKRSVIVKEWRVKGYRHEDVGSINKDGVFKAGHKEGKVTITATIENVEGYIIVGAFFITVSGIPPITIEGCVKLYDINKKPFYLPGGAEVHLEGEFYENLKELKAGINSISWLEERDTQSDPRSGRFKFVVPAHVEEPFIGWKVKLKDPSTTPPGYYWTHNVVPSSQAFSNEAHTIDIVKPGDHITIAPKGIKCFELWLKKRTTSLSLYINGLVIHRGQPVKNVKVRLFSYGKIVKKTLSDKNGEFELDIEYLPKGRYILTTARHEPKKPSATKPFVEPDPWQITTVDNLLYPKNEIPIELPLKTATKTINIEMITFAQKIGYRERGVKGGSTTPPGVSDEKPSRSNSLEWNDRPWVIDNNNSNGTYYGSGSGWEEEPERRPDRDVIFDRDDRSGRKGSGDDDDIHHNTDTNWGKPPSMEPYQKYNFE